jgi:hypothetical protein
MLVCILLKNKQRKEFEYLIDFFCKAIVPERENVLQCNCLHGKCAYHVDENSGQRLTGCVCLPGKFNN